MVHFFDAAIRAKGCLRNRETRLVQTEEVLPSGDEATAVCRLNSLQCDFLSVVLNTILQLGLGGHRVLVRLSVYALREAERIAQS